MALIRKLDRSFLLAMSFTLLCYIGAALRIASARSVWSPDCGARLIQVQAILKHWPHWWIAYPGSVFDPRHRNSPLYFYEFAHHGHIYIFYSFLFALISAIGFHWLGYFGLAVLPLLAGVGTAAMVYGIARILGLRFPLGPFFVCAFATPIPIYSSVFWDHSITTFIAALSLFLVLLAVVERKPILWIVAGASLGLGLWIHEILIPYLPALIVCAWMLRRDGRFWRDASLLVGGFLLLVVPLLIVNQSFYGKPLGPHLSNNRLGSGHAFVDWFGNWGLWLPGALYTLFAWGSSNPGFTWQYRSWLDQGWPPLHDTSTVFGVSLPLWLLIAAPSLLWVALVATRVIHKRWAPLAGLLVTFCAVAAFVWGQMDWPQVQREVVISAGLAVPLLLFATIGVLDLWREWWSATVAIMAGLIACGLFVIFHIDWPHSLFYACPFLTLAFGACGPFRGGRDKDDPLDGAESSLQGATFVSGRAETESRAARRRRQRSGERSQPASYGGTAALTAVRTYFSRPRRGESEAARARLFNAVAATTAFYTLAALFNPALGGAEWGSRYLLITVPALTLFAWAAVERLIPMDSGNHEAWKPGSQALVAMTGLLLVLSVALQVRGFVIVDGMHRENRNLANAIAQTPDPVVITSVWWVPLDAAPAYPDKLIYYAGDDDHPSAPLWTRLKKSGIRTITTITAGPHDYGELARLEGYFPVAWRTVFTLGVVRYGLP